MTLLFDLSIIFCYDDVNKTKGWFLHEDKKLVYTAMLMAISVVGGSLLSFNIGIAKVAPVQHFINLISAVLLGPGYAILQAFGSSILRNLLGTGTLLAFPGSMFGAGFSGLFLPASPKSYLCYTR